jgi:pimeloyl-ACP methyl ester carboxylesterase
MAHGGERLRRAASTVKLGPATVRASVVGDGPVVLLCSGLSSPIEAWGPLVDRLDSYRFVTFDVPGVGESPNSCRPLRIGQVATLAAALLDHVGVARAHVIGFSWGGAVAQHFAWRSPDRLDRLVLASTSVGLGAVPGIPVAYPSASRAATDHSGAAHHGASARSAAAEHLAARPTATIGGFLAQVGAIATWSSLPWLRRIDAPTLVLAGADDLLVPPLNAHLLAWAIAQAEVDVLAGLGHGLFDPGAVDRVAPRIDAFLTSRCQS